MKSIIRQILKEDIKEKIKSQVEKLGLYGFSKLSNLSINKIINILGEDFLTTKIMIDFIDDFINYYGSFSVHEVGYDPIPYNETSEEYREISYFSRKYVFVDVYNENNNLGDFKVLYYNLTDDKLMECFILVADVYEDEKLGNI